MLCSYKSANPFYLSHAPSTSSQRDARWPLIFLLMLGTVHMVSASQTGSTSASTIPTHSNFFRAVHRGKQRISRCGNDPNFCSNPEKNPWGGEVCCFGKFCKDVMNDSNHCGGCGLVCGYGLVCCDGKCVDIRNDPHHCGSCFQQCPGQNRCSYSMCDYGR